MALIFGKRSKEALSKVHPDLVKIHYRVLNKYGFDHSVLEGLRSLETQQEYFAKGRDSKGNVVNKSKVITNCDGVKKKSNHQEKKDGLGYATDSAPYPIDFSNKEKARQRFYYFAGLMNAAAKELFMEGEINHSLRWGGDWNSNNDFNDQSFTDLPHHELLSA